MTVKISRYFCSFSLNKFHLMHSFFCWWLRLPSDILRNWHTFGGNRSTDGAAIKRFLDFLGCSDLGFYWMISHKNLYIRYKLLERKMVQFLWTYHTRGRCNSVFSQILLIVIPRLIVNGILQFFFQKIRNIRKITVPYIYKLVQYVCTNLSRGRCSYVFQKFS